MYLKVDDKIGVWGFNSTIDSNIKLWFSFADPRPQLVNMDKLPEDVNTAIRGALRTNILIEVNQKGEKIKLGPAKTLIPKGAVRYSQQIQRKAQSVLKLGATTIKKTISEMTNQPFLEAALDTESNGKNRKTVIVAIQKRLKGLAPAGEKNNPYTGTITEGESQEVKFKIAKMNLKENDLQEVPFEAVTLELEEQIEDEAALKVKVPDYTSEEQDYLAQLKKTS